MSEPSVFDVNADHFNEEVVQASHDRLVVVDFWAPWCGPCRTLGPILDRVTGEFGERVALAKVNVDENPELARAWSVQGIPAVKIFRDGKPVAEFVGARPEDEVRQTIKALVPSAADELSRQGDQLAQSGSPDHARARYADALTEAPGHIGATLGLARLEADAGQLQAAERLAAAVEEGVPQYEEAQGILARVRFALDCRSAGGLDEARKRAEAAPDDPDAGFDLGQCLAGEGEYEAALETLVAIVERDKGFRDGAAKDAMLKIFSIVGQGSDLANRFRPRLARALY